MEEEDAIMLKTKKKKLAIDPDEEAEGKPNFITTKTQEEKADRDSFEHKVNGDKPKEAKKQPEKKEDAKPKTDNRSASPSKPKPAGDKDKQNVKRDTDHKVVVKPKPIVSSGSEKKTSETNGQVQKKAPEERKTPSNPPPKKKRVESSEESESESEDEKPRKKQVSSSKPKPKPKKESSAGPETKTVVKTKDVLVYDVLKRWWYCVPDWPPAGFDYNAELAKQKLRKVDQKYWRIEPETDANGFKKVFEMPSYPGLFKNSKGEIIDLRPKDSCPSYEVFKKKSILELCELKAKALKNQIEELEKSVVVDEDLLRQLKKELIQAEKSYERQKEKK